MRSILSSILWRTNPAFKLLCPYLITLSVSDKKSDLGPKVDVLLAVCKRVRGNIAARTSEEHIYDLDGSGRFSIMTGEGSAKHFRDNFYRRLAEVFYNLEWLMNNQPGEFRFQEFLIYDETLRRLWESSHDPALGLAMNRRNSIIQLLESRNATPKPDQPLSL